MNYIFYLILIVISSHTKAIEIHSSDYQFFVEENNCFQSLFTTQQNIVVKISTQRLYLCLEGQLVKSYTISTSKYGIGSQAGSNKTPLGLHYIKNKIGDGMPLGMIFKGRKVTGRIAVMNQSNSGDLVTTRIMWLEGKEHNLNKGKGIDSYNRYIYIHGTAEENKIGKPASHGCIRMYNQDVIDLYTQVKVGTEVYITE